MRRLRWFLIDYLAAFALFLSLSYAFYAFAPLSFWASYRSVDIADTSIADGAIGFRSFRDVRRKSNLGGTDVLYCDLNGDGEFGHFSSQTWRSDSVAPTDGAELTGAWAYRAPTPGPGVACYLRSVPAVRLPYLITRQMDPLYTDEPFIIEP